MQEFVSVQVIGVDAAPRTRRWTGRFSCSERWWWLVRVAGYVRVSTDVQAEKGFGLQVQQKAIRAWAKEQGHRLIRICGDEAASGAKELDRRPALAEALGMVRRGDVGGIVVPRLDRLARDLILQEQLLVEVKRGGGQLFSTSSGEQAFLQDDASDPSRRLIRQVLGAVSEYQRAMIALRLASGRARKNAAGGYAYGAPGLGFRAEGGALVRDEKEAAALLRITELREKGNSLREIAATLTTEGYQPKRSRHWHPESLRRTLNRVSDSPTSCSTKR
jgi:DNA invertase Pin-like site-specific DNA recombinase